MMKVSVFIALVFTAFAALWLFWGEEKYEQYEMFKNARQSGNVFKYEEYYRYYSQGRFSDIMRDSVVSYYSRVNSIKVIQEAAHRNQYNTVGKRLTDLVLEKADKEYTKAMNSGSVVELERFVNDCPAEFQKDAKAILEEMAWANDTVAWETARRRNTKEAYQTYLDHFYGEGSHAEEAINTIAGMLVRGKIGKLGNMYKTGGGGSSSSVRITNRTSHKMKVFFSGKDSRYIVLDSFESGVVRLVNGHYDVVASVDDPTVIPFGGEYELTGGSYSSDFVIRFQLSSFRRY